MDSHDIVRRPLHTEKSVTDMRMHQTYHFEVLPRASKDDIKRAVQELFEGVKVLAVHTSWIRGKQRRHRWAKGRTADRKKAIVKLRPGDHLDLGY